MPTTANEPVTNAIDAIASTIEAAALGSLAGTDTLSVVRGFAREETLVLPTLTIALAGRADRTNCHPEVISETEEDATHVAIVVLRARFKLPLQLDLWTRDATDRYKLLPYLEGLFFAEPGDPPDLKPPGLDLTLANGYDAPCRVVLLDRGRQDDGSASSGIYREQLPAEAWTRWYTRHVLDKADWSVTDVVDVGLNTSFG